MKKKLRNILVLAMGLMTTVSFAQDWDADSRTRIDMNGDGDEMSTDQRATVGATWGGSDWSIHGSTNVNYTLGTDETGAQNAATIGVYEAYASTDLMGYASVTVGRQALDYGSGAIMSSNQWGANRATWDGFTFGLDLDMADVTLGYASTSGEDADISGKSQMWLNAAKGEGDWNANLLYVSTTIGAADAMTAMGLDLSYAMMGGDLNLDVSYNTATGYSAEDMDMTMLGATYNVNESMSISGSQTTYGENGFDVGSASMGGYNNSGSLGYLGADDVNLAIGGAYAMGDFTLGVTMNTITNEASEDDREVMDISVGYTMSANANLSLSMATDTEGDAETNYMWVTLNIMP
jgi:hypothetical protein|tara:strand:+ start:8537 stop:9586 length:1050 start_codon:yes stop_codon:yes gene_type:complete